MAGADPTVTLTAILYNACYHVRVTYARGGRLAQTSRMAQLRAEAIHALGLAVRSTFNATEDFEPLLVALVDGLVQKDDWPRF